MPINFFYRFLSLLVYNIYGYFQVFILKSTLCFAVSFEKPRIGEHTVSILQELKYTDEKISSLQKGGAVYQAQNSKL